MSKVIAFYVLLIALLFCIFMCVPKKESHNLYTMPKVNDILSMNEKEIGSYDSRLAKPIIMMLIDEVKRLRGEV